MKNAGSDLVWLNQSLSYYQFAMWLTFMWYFVSIWVKQYPLMNLLVHSKVAKALNHFKILNSESLSYLPIKEKVPPRRSNKPWSWFIAKSLSDLQFKIQKWFSALAALEWTNKFVCGSCFSIFIDQTWKIIWVLQPGCKHLWFDPKCHNCIFAPIHIWHSVFGISFQMYHRS